MDCSPSLVRSERPIKHCDTAAHSTKPGSGLPSFPAAPEQITHHPTTLLPPSAAQLNRLPFPMNSNSQCSPSIFSSSETFPPFPTLHPSHLCYIQYTTPPAALIFARGLQGLDPACQVHLRTAPRLVQSMSLSGSHEKHVPSGWMEWIYDEV